MCKLEVSQMAGMTRLRCIEHNFYAAVIGYRGDEQTERSIRQYAEAHVSAQSKE